jgi:hypothetical protein
VYTHLQEGTLTNNKMDLTTLRVYLLNISAITVSTFNILEDSLKILLLIVSIGYTISKWWEMKKKK